MSQEMNDMGKKNLLHVGELIIDVRKDKGIRSSDLADRINRARQTIQNIYHRESIDTDLLFAISEALDHNFFQDLADEFSRLTGIDSNNRSSAPQSISKKSDKENKSAEKKGGPLLSIQLNFEEGSDKASNLKNLEWLNQAAREFLEREEEERKKSGNGHK